MIWLFCVILCYLKGPADVLLMLHFLTVVGTSAVGCGSQIADKEVTAELPLQSATGRLPFNRPALPFHHHHHSTSLGRTSPHHYHHLHHSAYTITTSFL